MPSFILFTDLDGTLLDGAYSWDAAAPALHAIRKASIPCVICSSKTRTEIEHYRKNLSNDHPFVCENGGGIFIPKGYFGPSIQRLDLEVDREDDYDVIRLGTPYTALRGALVALRAEGFEVQGFGDLSPEEVARVTGLDIVEARMAKDREYDEPFLFKGDKATGGALLRAIEAKGLHYAKGHLFYHLMGDNDKGEAVSMLIDLYRHTLPGDPVTVALGDAPNDLPMLQAVNVAIVVQKPGGIYDERFTGMPFIRAPGVGPAGWNMAVLELLQHSHVEY